MENSKLRRHEGIQYCGDGHRSVVVMHCGMFILKTCLRAAGDKRKERIVVETSQVCAYVMGELLSDIDQIRILVRQLRITPSRCGVGLEFGEQYSILTSETSYMVYIVAQQFKFDRA
jgi:hypothetical protein